MVVARSLTLADWASLFEAALTLARVQVRLRLQSPAKVIAWATHLAERPSTASPADVKRVAWSTDAAARHLVPSACLARSIALARMLARRRLPVDIRIGVRTDGGRLEAHAWVERDGQLLNDDRATVEGYETFARPLGDLAAIRSRFR
jgi:hypothetical protein